MIASAARIGMTPRSHNGDSKPKTDDPLDQRNANMNPTTAIATTSWVIALMARNASFESVIRMHSHVERRLGWKLSFLDHPLRFSAGPRPMWKVSTMVHP